MKKYLLTILLFTLLSQLSAGQDLYDKISDKMCKCLEKENAVDTVGGKKCYKKILFKFSNELVKYHKLNSIEELDQEEFTNRIMGRMIHNCKFMMKTFKDSVILDNPKFVADTNPICDSVHTGEFYYVEYDSETNTNDTTYATFSGTEYLEKIQKNNSYSRLSIQWVSGCRFKLIFAESDDPVKKLFNKPGDVFEYEIRKVTEDSFFVEYIWDGPKVFVEYKRVK